MKFSFIGLLLIVIGGLYLGNNLGFFEDMNITLAQIWNTYWPLLLILVGAGMFVGKKPKNRD